MTTTNELQWSIRHVLLWVAGVAMLTSCMMSEEVITGTDDDDGRVAVRFASGFEVAPTKVGGDNGNIWGATDTVGIYMVDDGGDLSQVLGNASNVPYYAATSGATRTDLLPAGDTLFYPATGEVNFFLYYPYTQAINGTNYPVNLSNQSNQGAIDLMYAHDTQARGKTSGKVDIRFEHKLAKLVFRIAKGGDIPSLNGLTFEIDGVATQSTFDLSTALLADAGAGGTGGIVALVTPLTNDSVKAEAIVLPVKDIDASKISLRIKVGGKDYIATLPPASGSTAIEAGNRYTYTILLDINLITISGEIDPWNIVEGDQPGFGEVPPPSAPTFTLEQVLVTKGVFQMGSPTSEPGRVAANETLHEVTLTQDFNMSKYETTNEQFAEFLNAFHIGATGMGNVDGFGSQRLVEPHAPFGVVWNGSTWQPATGKENHPVVYVTWYGAKAFADWVGGSLPTDAQWEYACRAGTQTAYYFGADESDLGDYEWFVGNGGGTTHPVGQKLPNPWGLYDMHGNVHEWCSDWFEADLGTAAVTDPAGTATGTSRVKRGASWFNPAPISRSAYRGPLTPFSVQSGLGFRVIFVVP